MKILSCLFLSFLPVLPFLPKQYPFSTQKTELKNLQGEEPAWREKKIKQLVESEEEREREMMTGLSIFLAADKLHLWKSCVPLAYVFCPLARKQFLRSEISFSFPSFSFYFCWYSSSNAQQLWRWKPLQSDSSVEHNCLVLDENLPLVFFDIVINLCVCVCVSVSRTKMEKEPIFVLRSSGFSRHISDAELLWRIGFARCQSATWIDYDGVVS